jgi:hypothetical protein
MVDSELQLVYEQLRKIKRQVESLESEIRLKFEPVLEERDLLRNRIDPYSYDCASLADCDEI